MRAVALWLLLFGIYAATFPVSAQRGGVRFTDAEAHALLATRSMARTGNVDLRDDYGERAWRAFRRAPLRRQGALTGGRYVEPTGLGYPALAAPAYLVAGSTGVALESAALLALAFVLALALARRVVPDPWASAGVLTVAVSVPALAAGTSATPQPAAAAALAGAALLAVRARERPGRRVTLASAFLLGLVPWLSPALILPAAAVAIALVRWVARSRRPVRAIAATEVILTVLVTYGAVNEQLFGGLTPVAARSDGTFATSAAGYAHRVDRLVGALLDRSFGLLLWAPILALAVYAGWLLWRLRRHRLARAVPGEAETESTVGMLAGAAVAGLVGAALLSPASGLPSYPAQALLPVLPLAAVLAAWALRHTARVGTALIALTLAATAWLLAALIAGSAGGWAAPGAHPPWRSLLPRYDSGSAGGIVSGVVTAALAALVAATWLRERDPALQQERPDPV